MTTLQHSRPPMHGMLFETEEVFCYYCYVGTDEEGLETIKVCFASIKDGKYTGTFTSLSHGFDDGEDETGFERAMTALAQFTTPDCVEYAKKLWTTEIQPMLGD